MHKASDYLASNASIVMLDCSPDIELRVVYMSPFTSNILVAVVTLKEYSYEAFIKSYALAIDRLFEHIYDRLD